MARPVEDWSEEDAAYRPPTAAKDDAVSEEVRHLRKISRNVGTITTIIVIYAVISLLLFLGTLVIYAQNASVTP